MAYTKFEQAYVDAYMETLYPSEPEQPDTLLASGPVKSDVQPEFGTIKGIPQTRFEKILEQSGIKLNELGNLIDEQAPGTLNSLTGKQIPIIGELKIRDLLPFVGSEKDGQISGTPGALIAAGTGQPLGGKPVVGSAIGPDGQTYYGTSGSPAMFNQDVGTAVVDVATLGLGKPLAKLGKKAIEATKDLPIGMSIKNVSDTPIKDLGESLLMPVNVGDKQLKIPADKAAVLQKAIKNLTPEEQAKLRTDTATKMVDILTTLPSTKEFASAAIGGIAKKGWYEGSAKAIIEVFGQDGPRFAALLSATSPQTSVESNLYNALHVWKNWTAAGRPQNRESIISVMGQSVQGNKGEESVLDAWKNNSVRALTSEDPKELVLSGPKVDSFMKNLQGNVEQVTNDAWMASFSLVDQTIFSGSLTKTDAGKGPGYLAMNARVRDTAKYLTKLTGETWTPAEVQETIWSWAKTLYERASDANETRSALQLIKDNAITDELIASTPDFRTLFYDEKYAPILEQAGYKSQLDKLRSATTGDNAESGVKKPRSSIEASKALGGSQSKLLESNAKRLDKLRLSREQASAEKALSKQNNEGAQ
jgi:hypothetical protein